MPRTPAAGVGGAPPSTGFGPPPSAGDLDSVVFDPKEYIRVEYQSIDFNTFSTVEVANLDEREEEADLAIKKLVQTHLSTFIECKDAMDALYEKEEELFVGDALDPTKQSFSTAVSFVDRTTQTLVDLFDKLQTVERQDESLKKLMAILRVPGVIYSSCGARVARVMRSRDAQAAASKNGGSAATSRYHSVTEVELRELRKRLASHRRQLLSGTSSAANISASSDDGSTPPSSEDDTHDGDGAGDRKATSGRQVDDELEQGEVRELWCGVELIRSRQSEASYYGGGSEFDSAVQALRSALRFMEEHHDMITGAPTNSDDAADNAADDEQASPPPPQHNTPQHNKHHQHLRKDDDHSDDDHNDEDTSKSHDDTASTHSGAGGGGVSAAASRRRNRYDHQLFTFRFAHALLCSCLYLANALHVGVFHTDVSDAVQLEHHLDLLLETSIVSVRLRHFCAVLRERLMQSRSTGQALQAVQQALARHENDEDDENDDNNSTTTTVLDQSDVATSKSGGAPSTATATTSRRPYDDGAASTTRPATAPQLQPQHPLEAFFTSLRHHHSAAIVSQAEKYVREGWSVTPASTKTGTDDHNLRRQPTSGTGSFENQSMASPPMPQVNNSFLIFHNNMNSNPQSATLDGDRGGDIDEEALLGTINVTSNGSATPSSAAQYQQQNAASGVDDDDEDDDLITAAFLREHQPAYLLHSSSAAGSDDAASVSERRRTEVERTVVLRKNAATVISSRPILRASFDMLIAHALRVVRRHADRRGVAAAGGGRGSSSGSSGKQSGDGDDEDSFVATPMYGFVEALVSDLQTRLVAYWRGLGASVHGGNFDVPVAADPQLAQAVFGRGLGKGVVPVATRVAMDGAQLLTTTAEDDAATAQDLPNVPQLRFVPVTTTPPRSEHDADGEGDNNDDDSAPLGQKSRGASKPSNGPTPLIDISVHAVQRMVKSTSDILGRVIEAFGRHMCGNGWLLSQSLHVATDDPKGSGGSDASSASSASLDMRCSVAVQVLLNHIQAIATATSASFTAMKVAVVETAKKDVITTDAQLSAATSILGAIEEGRETVVKAVLFAAELLVKTFLLSSITVACRPAGANGSLASRLLRGSITTCVPVKCFNVYLVFVDRLRALFCRFDETHDLLANARQQQQQQNRQLQEQAALAASEAAAAQRRSSRRRSQRGGSAFRDEPPPPPPPMIEFENDQVLEAVAEYNAQLVRQHLESHLQLIEQSIVNLLAVPIDACHLRCHQTDSDAPSALIQGSPAPAGPSGGATHYGRGGGDLEREVECIADLLCFGNVLPALVVDFVFLPNIATIVFQQLRQRPTTAEEDEGGTPAKKKSQKKSARAGAAAEAAAASATAAAELEQQRWLTERRVGFMDQHGSMLQEMAFVAIESVLGKLVAAAQANVTSIVAQQGFSKPGLDWSRIGPGDLRIRPYVIDCLMVAARVQEALAEAEVPALAFAAVLRVMTAMGWAMVASFQSGSHLSHFDLTAVPFPSFYVYGVALLELEARFCVSTLERLLASCAPVLTLAGSRMASSLGDAARIQLCAEDVVSCIATLTVLVKKLETMGVGACDQLSAQQGLLVGGAVSAKQRKDMIEAASRRGEQSTRLVVDALSSFLDSAAIAVTAAAAATGARLHNSGSDASSFAERLQQARRTHIAQTQQLAQQDTRRHQQRGRGVLPPASSPLAEQKAQGGQGRRVVHIREPSNDDESGAEGHEHDRQSTKQRHDDAVISRLEGATRNSLRSHRNRSANEAAAAPTSATAAGESGAQRRSLRRGAASATAPTPVESPPPAAAEASVKSSKRSAHGSSGAARAAATAAPVVEHHDKKAKRGERFRR